MELFCGKETARRVAPAPSVSQAVLFFDVVNRPDKIRSVAVPRDKIASELNPLCGRKARRKLVWMVH
jgi:hypothetical protein